MNKLISIIIPVYNAKESLGYCLDTLIEQTFGNWEAIIVNDGSTDNCGEVCDEYAKKDSRFIVLHQENQGVSSARNKGIEASHGEWITFIDADDYVDRSYLETLNKYIQTESNTLIIQGLKQISNGKIKRNIEFLRKELINSNISKAFGELKIFEYGYTVAKLYKKEIINKYHIRFYKEISYSEDLIFMLEYILRCDSIKYIEGSGYNYVVDASSLSQRYNSFESEYALFERYNSLNNAIADRFSFEPTNSSLRNGALILMRSIYSMYINNEKSKKERLEIIRNILKDKDTYIKKYYKPQIHIFKAIKMALLIHPVLFDIVCKIKFR